METQGAGEGFSFAGWLSTGRLIRTDVRCGAREVKFNPNHDPRDGRFTFAEGGGGAAGISRRPRNVPRSATRTRASPPTDAIDRTHEANGELHLADNQQRSKTNQRQAGGADRRATDDGGHFIATRFGGPTDAFNHFAQDASFNRGNYRALEDTWAKDLRSGKHVSVDITARYTGASRRPDSLTVRSTVNGQRSTAIPESEPSPTSRKDTVMIDKKLDLLGPALSDIGKAVMTIIGGKPDDVYLYVEAGEGWADVSLFRDEGSQVRYFDTGDSDLWCLLLDARCIEPADKRWSGMEYTIDGGKFDAKFQFDDVERGYEGSDDRRQQYLRARYGDKPVIYPPVPPGAMELRPAK